MVKRQGPTLAEMVRLSAQSCPDIAAMDLFVVPTPHLRLALRLRHCPAGPSELCHFKVTMYVHEANGWCLKNGQAQKMTPELGPEAPPTCRR